MSGNTRSSATRRASTTLSTRVEALESKLDRILALVEGPAKATTRKARTSTVRPARKAAPKKAAPAVSYAFSGRRVENGTRKLTRSNREAFIAGHGWAKPGMSTNALRAEVAGGAKVNKGWNVAI